MLEYTVRSSRVEPRRGARFMTEEIPSTQGALCLFEINKHLIIGRRIEDWIIQPDRWIYIGDAVVRCLGRVVLL